MDVVTVGGAVKSSAHMLRMSKKVEVEMMTSNRINFGEVDA